MNAPGTARSVLECGSPLPLWIQTTTGEPSKNPNGIPSQSPGLRGTSYPGKDRPEFSQPQWGCGSGRQVHDATPLGLRPILLPPQGSSCLATLGWRAQSLWDWSTVLLAALLLSGICGHAQSFSIDWFTIDGGGGTSTGGVFAVSGTIGQSDANPQPMTGGSFTLIGGFWSLFAVQTPGAPLLTIRLTSANAATVSWPSPSAGFILQQNADLNTSNWVAASQTVTDNGSNRSIIVNPPAGNRFYRLFKP